MLKLELLALLLTLAHISSHTLSILSVDGAQLRSVHWLPGLAISLRRGVLVVWIERGCDLLLHSRRPHWLPIRRLISFSKLRQR